jgi:hypothetical protein
VVANKFWNCTALHKAVLKIERTAMKEENKILIISTTTTVEQ